MNVSWHASAVAELEEAALHFGGIDDDLGEQFAAAAEIAVAEINASPKLARKFDGQARKVRLKRFPYGLVYWIGKDTLHIVCVMHLHREPGYWRGRMP